MELQKELMMRELKDRKAERKMERLRIQAREAESKRLMDVLLALIPRQPGQLGAVNIPAVAANVAEPGVTSSSDDE